MSALAAAFCALPSCFSSAFIRASRVALAFIASASRPLSFTCASLRLALAVAIAASSAASAAAVSAERLARADVCDALTRAVEMLASCAASSAADDAAA